MVENVLPQLVEKATFAHKLLEHTAGITLHIVEILHECAQDDLIIEELPAPRSLTRIIHQRLQRMLPSHRKILESLAVVNYPCTLAEIIEYTGESDPQPKYLPAWKMRCTIA